MLEVIGQDRARREVYVMAGFGRSADWYRNLHANSVAEVAIGQRHFRAIWRELDDAEAADVLADYERRNALLAPIVRVVLSRLAGWPYDGSADARRRLVSQLPVIALALRT